MANWKADFYTWTCGIDLVFINELNEISGINRGAGPHVVIDQCQSTLQTRRHGVDGWLDCSRDLPN